MNYSFSKDFLSIDRHNEPTQDRSMAFYGGDLGQDINEGLENIYLGTPLPCIDFYEDQEF